jgi:hypothetical protein
MNVIVDVRGINVNMRVSEDPKEGIFYALRQRRSIHSEPGATPQGLAKKI